jgi:hypothetical protein
MKIKAGASLLLAYLLWIVTLALGAWFAVIGREAFETYLGKYFIQEQGQFLLSRQARFWDLTVAVVLWLLWFVMMIITEEYYRRGVPKKTVWRRFAKVTGILLILIFVADLCQNLMLGIGTVGWLRWLLTVIELVAGVALTYLSRLKPAPPGINPGTGAV